MAVLPIIHAPDPRLKKKSVAVEAVDANIRQLMADMLETMYLAPGIGLAAPQVGQNLRVIVIDVADEGESARPLKMANPEIISVSEVKNIYSEGCLSLPEHYAEVERPEKVRVRYLDAQNDVQEIDAEGLLATCIQHEMDHLEGILFVDHLSRMKKDMILRKMKKFKKDALKA